MSLEADQVEKVKATITEYSEQNKISYLHKYSDINVSVASRIAKDLQLQKYILLNPIISELTCTLLDDLQLDIDAIKIAQKCIELHPMNNNEQNTLIAIQEKVSRLLSIDLHPQQVDLDLHWIQKFAPNINLKILLPKTLNDAISLLSSDSNLYKVLGVYQLPQLYSHAPNALKYKETINLHRLVSNVPCSFLLGPRQSHNLKSSFAREIISFQPEIFIKICKFSHWELASIVQTIEVLDDQTQQLFLSYPEVQCIFETKALNMQ